MALAFVPIIAIAAVVALQLTLVQACAWGSASLPSGALTRFSGNPLVRNGPQAYDASKTGPRAIVKMGPTDYRMWYEAVAGGNPGDLTTVGYATSTDGLIWTKVGSIMSSSATWERDEVSPNSVLFEGGVFKMWYHSGGFFSAPGIRSGVTRIGYATSNDGVNWTKFSGNPVLDVDASGAFDDLQVAEPRVFNLKTLGLGTGYRMYFTGQTAGRSRSTALGLATSADGITWTKYSGNPIIVSASWGGWGGGFVRHNGVWNLWHATFDSVSGLVYKSSMNGIAGWTNGPSNPVLTPSGNSSAADFSALGDSVSAYLDGTVYRIMYTGTNLTGFPAGREQAACLATIAAR